MEPEATPPVQGVAEAPNMPPSTSPVEAPGRDKIPNSKTTAQQNDTRREHPALAELNSQLYARGLTRSGLKLEGLNSKAQDQVVKVISKLLSQRTNDFTQLESMQTSHRVLSHDLDRLTDLHKDLKKRVIGAEKERELARSQVATLSQKLKREEDAHKLAREDFARAQSALTLVRTQAQHDIKKREVQLERTLQHWQRVSSENTRLLSAGYRTGLTCLNPIEAPEQAPRVDSLFDPSIRELDHQIISLQEECEAFRHVTLSTANQLLKLEALAKQEAEPVRIDAATFFKAHGLNSTQTSSSTSHPLTADTRLREIMARLKSCIETDAETKEEAERLKKDLLSEMVNSYEGERVQRVKELMEQKMQEMVAALDSAKLGEGDCPYAQTLQSATHLTSGVVADQAVLAQEKEELDQDRAAVDAEGKRVTETLVRLAQDRAVFEIERTAFLEERRRFEMEKVMQEPPLQPRDTQSSPSSKLSPSNPPKTPEKAGRVDTGESSSDRSSQESQPSTSSIDIRISPTKINTRPAISSPLANSTAIRHTAARVRSPLHRRRTTKGPSTPLARFVSHKIVAEKLASAKKKPVPPEEATDKSDGSAETVKPVSRTIQARAPRSTTLTAPTSSSALKSTTKANERPGPSHLSMSRGLPVKRMHSPAELLKPDSFSADDAGPRRLANSATSRMPPSANAVRKDIPSTVRAARRLEVGQAAGIGPRNAAQTATWR